MTNAFKRRLLETGETPRAFWLRSGGLGINSVYNLYNNRFRRCPLPSTLRRVAELTGLPFERLYADFIAPYETARAEQWRERRKRPDDRQFQPTDAAIDE
jgi:hypothetical protein